MTLEQWMKENHHDDATFGDLVGRDRSQISRIRRGKSTPPDDLKILIAEKTAGAIPVTAWFPALPETRVA